MKKPAKKNKKIIFSNKGFTLVELMVSLTLFTVVTLATISSLLIVNDASRKVQKTRAVMDNLNFAMDTMVRTIRTGSDYKCGASNNCPYPETIGLTSMSVVPDDSMGGTNVKVDFDLSNGRIRRQVTTNGASGGWQDLTAPEINVTGLRFFVRGADAADGIQPSVTIFAAGNVTTPGNQPSPFAIQTRISQRTIE